MSFKTNGVKKNILVVARWPLGGIRTYMRYTFRHLPQDYQLTLLASSTHEDGALKRDVSEYGARLLITSKQTLQGLINEVFKELFKKRYDVILSQGFIAGVAVFFANIFFRFPHIITIHGIVEPRLLEGRFRWVKRIILKNVLSNVSMIYAVSEDILAHLYEQFPSLKLDGRRAVVIPNGIDMSEFEMPQNISDLIRTKLEISTETFLFGFFGRFMQLKGFDLLIDAVDALKNNSELPPFKVLAVGSGDYLPFYQKVIRERQLDEYFVFIPFQENIRNLYLEINAIVMPSRSEASGLLAMEALAMGTPLIASDCIGLRETVAGTPAYIFPTENIVGLMHALIRMLKDCCVEKFRENIPIARLRYDVTGTAHRLAQVIDEIT